MGRWVIEFLDWAARAHFVGTMGWAGGGWAVTFFATSANGWDASSVWIASLIAGACCAIIFIAFQSYKFGTQGQTPVEASAKSSSDLMSDYQDGKWQIVYPPLPGEYRPPSGHILLKEAATRAYEQTRGSLSAEAAERDAKHPDDVLQWYGIALTLTENRRNNNNPLLRLFGVRPPSRITEEIKIRNSYFLTIGPGGSFLSESNKVVFENLTVHAADLSLAIERLKD